MIPHFSSFFFASLTFFQFVWFSTGNLLCIHKASGSCLVFDCWWDGIGLWHSTIAVVWTGWSQVSHLFVIMWDLPSMVTSHCIARNRSSVWPTQSKPRQWHKGFPSFQGKKIHAFTVWEVPSWDMDLSPLPMFFYSQGHLAIKDHRTNKSM